MRVHTGGPAQVGQTLTASPSCIADANGLTKWLANDTEIDGPTSSTYTLQASVNGKVITVRVAFTDDGWRLQNELGWHHDRGNLLRFLDDPSIEPTNNRAERALRGAVIARKVSHCSKNVGGADAFSAFTSVIRTLARNGGVHSLVNGLCGVFSGAPVPTPSF